MQGVEINISFQQGPHKQRDVGIGSGSAPNKRDVMRVRKLLQWWFGPVRCVCVLIYFRFVDLNHIHIVLGPFRLSVLRRAISQVEA